MEYLETIGLPWELGYLEVMRKAIIKFCKRASTTINPLTIIELELASNEVFTNIVLHSLPRDPAVKIELTLEMYRDRIQIHFDYKGMKFAPKKVEPPVYEKIPAGGFGLYIIHRVVDEVTYKEVDSHIQRISLTKYLNFK